MKICKNCGASCSDDMNFCSSCGEKLGEAVATGATAGKAMSFGEALKTFFVKFGDFKGRASKAEFWWGYLMFTVFETVIVPGVTAFLPILGIIMPLASFAILIPHYASFARRLHDTGRSGWWSLLPIVRLIFCYGDSEPGANRFGEKPIK